MNGWAKVRIWPIEPLSIGEKRRRLQGTRDKLVSHLCYGLVTNKKIITSRGGFDLTQPNLKFFAINMIVLLIQLTRVPLEVFEFEFACFRKNFARHACVSFARRFRRRAACEFNLKSQKNRPQWRLSRIGRPRRRPTEARLASRLIQFDFNLCAWIV